ncbi:hypothetical protein EOM39_03945 [Candidatus Gracilibacteria bacterium]|nr:hypothetical protein [Candidatus Gracilibacteria bacterium]
MSSIVSSGYLDIVITTYDYTAYFTDNDKVSGTGTNLILGYSLYDDDYIVYDNSLVGYWDMETLTSDYKLKDLSKYGNNGTCYNNTTSVNCGNSSEGPKIVDSNGTSGKAMSFDGLDDRIRINHDPNISFPGEITIYTKFYLDKICTTHVDGDPCLDTLVMKGGAFNPGFWLFANGYKKYYIEINGNNGGYLVISNQENKIGINTLVFTKKQDNNKYYINGLLDKEQTSNYLLLNNTDNLTIGTAMDTTNRVFDGLIDEVRIYNRVLTDNEIKMLYDLNK